MAGRAPSDQERGERAATLVEWLARDEWEYLVGAARRSGAPPDAVDDVIQEALVDVLRSFGGPYDRDHVRAYTYRCTQWRAWKLLRQRRRTEHRTIPASADVVLEERSANAPPDPLAAVLRKEELAEARGSLRELPPGERAALVLLAAGFERAAVRRALGLSERQLRRRVERGNSRLRQR